MRNNLEIEAKFLEIDKTSLIKKLNSLSAKDKGEDKISEMIFYDREGMWRKDGRQFIRIRKTNSKIFLTFKKQTDNTALGTIEFETEVKDAEQTKNILEAIALALFRHQEKIRHKFLLGEVTVDIDTWPKVPTYVELEGPSEEAIKEAALNLNFDWKLAVFGTAHQVIEDKYKIKVRKLKYFTFDKLE